MTDLYWVLAASAAVWLGLGGFAAFIALRQQSLGRRLELLERDHDRP